MQCHACNDPDTVLKYMDLYQQVRERGLSFVQSKQSIVCSQDTFLTPELCVLGSIRVHCTFHLVLDCALATVTLRPSHRLNEYSSYLQCAHWCA